MATTAVPAKLRTLVATTPPARAALVVEDATGSRIVELTGRTELGRDPSSGIVVDHPGVSWRHLRLAPDRDGTWTVTDLGSTNGTRVDGRRLDAPTQLLPGAEIALGSDGPRLRLQVPGHGDTETTATTTAALGY